MSTSASDMKNTGLALAFLTAVLGGCFDSEHRDGITIDVRSLYSEDRGVEFWIAGETGHDWMSFEGGDPTYIGTVLPCFGLDHPRLNAAVWTSHDGRQVIWSPKDERRLASASWILPTCDEDYLLEVDAHGALTLHYCKNLSDPPYRCRTGDLIQKA